MQYNYRAHAGLTLIARSLEALLCTVGPAGLQAAYVSCNVHNASIYAYIPRSLDLMSNLEQESEIILTTPIWQVYGSAITLPDITSCTSSLPPEVIGDANQLGLAIAHIAPRSMQVDLFEKTAHRETIDFVHTTSAATSSALHKVIRR